MKQPPEFFDESVELPLIYIAKRLKEALAVEEALTTAGFDYLVEPDRYSGGLIFQTERIGAFFYVMPAHEGQARELLTLKGFKPHVTK
jgi:hypothetical protein